MLRPNSRHEKQLFWQIIIGAVFTLAFILVGMVSCAAQEHKGHKPEDMAAHTKFYKTWNMPDNRAVSCCHDQDCSSAEAYQKNGKWYARQTGDIGEFTEIPPNKVELDRDSPDGRNHLCGRKYTYMGAGSGFTVFCFIAGAGG